MSQERRNIGLDRPIKLAWLNATAEGVARGLSPAELRAELDAVLDGEVPGHDPHSSRGKTKTVLLRVWLRTSPSLQPLRDDAAACFAPADPAHRLALHWGMTLAAYPFFADVVTTIGRLGVLQGNIPRQQIRRRLAELWGERTSIERAWPRAIDTLLSWGALDRTDKPDVYRWAEPMALTNPAVQRILVEALFHARGDASAPFADLVRGPALFPFRLSLSTHELRDHPRLDVVRHGLDEDVVVPRERGCLRAAAAR